MTNADRVYYSSTDKQSSHYRQTHDAPYRYLAYRDVPAIIKNFVPLGGKALDFGSGAGRSVQFLNELGFEVVGAEPNKEMLEQAKSQFPHFSFYPIENGVLPFEDASFDLVFSSFVLLEIGSQQKMLQYLSEARRVMKKNALFVAITGSEALHQTSRKWLDFSTDFPENKNLVTGNRVKLYHYDSHIEFADYYWTERDYRHFFEKTDFIIKEIKFPLGHQDEGYVWQDELFIAPFSILIAMLS